MQYAMLCDLLTVRTVVLSQKKQYTYLLKSLNLEKTQSNRMCRLPLSRYANTWLDHDDVSIGLFCAHLAPQWKENLRPTSVQVMNTWPLEYSITRLESQNRKFAPILIITGPKNDLFFVCKQTGFVDQRLWDFAKMTLNRVSSHWLWLESSHSVKNVTRVEPLTRVTLSSRNSTALMVKKSKMQCWENFGHKLDSNYWQAMVMAYSCSNHEVPRMQQEKKQQHQRAKIRFVLMKIQNIRVLKFSKLMVAF